VVKVKVFGQLKILNKQYEKESFAFLHPVLSDMFIKRVKNGAGCWDMLSQLYVL